MLSCYAIVQFLVAPLICEDPMTHQKLQQPYTFREFYAKVCYDNHGEGHWAGGHEESANVMKRIADGVALYQDYIVTFHEKCGKN